ncbi:MAG: MBL fold metallo-hydrolase [Chloroflexi bacterium]|nr:MBL fold metallo-hydrolase [Chloroflexota bacterium]MBI3931580.1 MBL fold metallo-hydrolase [Chloroflexota bacterium]
MSQRKGLLTRRSPQELYRIIKEKLNAGNAELASFFFNRGANFYVISYQKEGKRKHTFIDAGDPKYRNQILPILIENDVDPAAIERIVITHRHPDHCGLVDLLAKESGAKILVHSNFKSFVEGDIKPEERRWLGNFGPSGLKECDIEYLSQPAMSEVITIGGVDFPSLIEPIEIGEDGKLMILACPESTPTHSPDQIIILYTPQNCPHTYEKTDGNWPTTDGILFSGDLWLMRGPFGNWSVGNFFRHFRWGLYRLKNLVLGKGRSQRNHREQDAKAKEALKKGFHLVRVKPGHGEEFLGSRIIPDGLLAERDVLVGLGYSLDANKSILRQSDLAPRIAALGEQSYTSFVKELLFWIALGYSSSEVAAFLVRIYQEQCGGGSLVEKDRLERRERLKEILTRLRDEKSESEELQQVAESALSELERVL